MYQGVDAPAGASVVEKALLSRLYVTVLDATPPIVTSSPVKVPSNAAVTATVVMAMTVSRVIA